MKNNRLAIVILIAALAVSAYLADRDGREKGANSILGLALLYRGYSLFASNLGFKALL